MSRCIARANLLPFAVVEPRFHGVKAQLLEKRCFPVVHLSTGPSCPPHQQLPSNGQVGRAISVYSRVFRLIGCDAYTRTFYEARGFRGWVWRLLFSLTAVCAWATDPVA